MTNKMKTHILKQNIILKPNIPFLCIKTVFIVITEVRYNKSCRKESNLYAKMAAVVNIITYKRMFPSYCNDIYNPII